MAVGDFLVAAGVDPTLERATGRYVCRDAAATLAMFMSGRHVDVTTFTAVMGALVDSAARAGAPIMGFGEMAALLWARGEVSAALEVESAWNDLADGRRFQLLGDYPDNAARGRPDRSGPIVRDALSGPGVGRRGRSRALSGVGNPQVQTQRSEVFVPTAGAAGGARRFVSAVLTHWGLSDMAADVSLVVSELATNAVRHARSPFLVFVHHGPGEALLVGVKDAAAEPPVPDRPSAAEVNGRGLVIVDAVAQQWGPR